METCTCLLTGTLPNGADLRIPLVGDRLTVGRQNCDILLAHNSVSRSHAVLERREGGWLLSDAGSRNGTKVNGVAIARRLLANRDTLSFGTVTLRYTVSGGVGGDGATMTTKMLETCALEESATKEFASSPSAPSLVGRSAALQDAMRLAVRAAKARTEPLVLISGESGTGKELFARLVYDESRRRDKKFVVVNCGAIEPNLVGDTLFGHMKGAFTGALADKAGIFEEANGGTVFLDEIGEINAETQTKLLRVLQEGTLMRLGSNKEIKVDVRVICATNRDLRKAVKEGTFREDLYYRLNVIQIALPPLRERKGDVEDLVRHFTDLFGGGLIGLSDPAMKRLCAYQWPGNVRQLRNVIERTVTLAEGDVIQVADLPPEIQSAAEGATELNDPGAGTPAVSPGGTGEIPLAAPAPVTPLHVTERKAIEAALVQAGDNKKLAAQLLGISRSTLYEKLKQYGLE